MPKFKYQEHYTCENLVNSLDADGEKAAYYIVCSAERGPGKSYSFSKLLFEHWLNTGEKFGLIVRNNGDIGKVAEGIMDEYLSKEHPEYTLSEKKMLNGTYGLVSISKLVDEEVLTEEIGYVLPLRSADRIKRYSSIFSSENVWCLFFDEFQTFSDPYLPNEPELLRNIYKSVFRGGKTTKATRYGPIYMASNALFLGNPYFDALHINRYINSQTRFYRGRRVIFERCEVEGLKDEHAMSAIDIAMKEYIEERHIDNTWVMDEASLVEKPNGWGRGYASCNISYDHQRFTVYEYPMAGITYVSRKIDKTVKYVYNASKENGQPNMPNLKTLPMFLNLRRAFFAGKMRCQDASLQRIMKEILV